MNLDRFKLAAAAIDWTDLLNTSDINIANDIFETHIRKILDSEAPVVSRQIQMKNKRWITKQTRDQMTARDYARQTASQSQSVEDWQLYRKLRNKCTALSRSDTLKKNYQKLLENDKNDVSKLYSNIKQQLGWVSNGPPQALIIEGRLSNSSKKMTRSPAS